MTESSSTDYVATGPRRGGGPHPGLLALISLALFLAGLIVGAALSGGATLQSPFAETSDVVARFADHAFATRVAALFQFGSAVPLGIYAATVYARQLRLGIRVPGPAIGLYGGITASLLLLVSSMTTWVLSRAEVSVDGALTHALAYLSFITGGVGYVVGLGLLVAGLAVPALILKLVPAWLAWTGLVIAALSELSFVSMVVEPLQVLLPIGRFGGAIWLIIVGFLLPQTRAAANRERP
ncbi:hypothetical protein Aple_072190 [Acrocarpospora pleiomorpha]|uniref:DUF4386 domain-containing protein n=1 Tax=Acrocarpospora pleiomorpha TaxID=90975 RepID=A0A5M3XTW6_9ACTN|nr:hypothetical protein [Acrocarpospora pleiomorpha]GES24320.1 hypothetical protein Aple_072190 [Acrocarpospora pleiomorpha]